MRGYKRRIIRRIQALILAVLLCIPCLEAKTVDAAPKEKITVMSNIGKETMEPYLEAFEKKYPDICVKYCYYSDYETDMKEKAAEDDLGDVLFVPGCISTDEYSQRFEKLGNYEELADKYYYMEGSKYIEDDVYGIPSSAYLVGILYNKEVFNKAGSPWMILCRICTESKTGRMPFLFISIIQPDGPCSSGRPSRIWR